MSLPELPEIPEVTIELLPHEREALLKWIYTPDVRDQLEALDSPYGRCIHHPLAHARWLGRQRLNARNCKEGMPG